MPVTIDWDDAYANAAHIPGGADYPARWQARATGFVADLRDATPGRVEAGLRYGTDPRECLDLFHPDGPPRGLALFLHGGYWMAFGREDWSHLAAGALARGWAVAIPSYPLAPGADLPGILAACAAAAGAAGARVPGPIRLAGHSAGAQLALRLACADSPLAEPVARRLTGVLAISALADLRPLRHTRMAPALGLTQLAAARAESPALCEPRDGIEVTAWVGAGERPAFLGQTRTIAAVWSGLGCPVRSVEQPGRHHFDVIDDLARPDSAMVAAFLGED
ncbi:alpha/beta hydrolase [Frigidibacter oleivorans]|uniref:alpha/beta hydrolase n=1 Tax=Frigidibacter oleivorans TaxID=2487129 RepID=UPI000F8F2BF7|nr:alpha/beta hydrolase [Frigidibacter oleivorans]